MVTDLVIMDSPGHIRTAPTVRRRYTSTVPRSRDLDRIHRRMRRRYVRLSQCIDLLVLHRSQTHHGWQHCADARRFHEASLQALHKEMACEDTGSPLSNDRLLSFRRQADEDLQTLLARSAQTKAQEERRIALEGRFGRLQRSFMTAVDRFMQLH